MKYEIIVKVIFFTSTLGLGTIILRKIPALSDLSEVAIRKRDKALILKLKRKIKKLNPFKDFSYEMFLHRALTKIRILTLKTDNKTFIWLQKLRKKHQRKKIKKKDNYWEEIKKATKNM